MDKSADDVVDYPTILSELKGDYDCINCEFIGDKLIEVHLRANEDMGEYTEIIPVWNENDIELDVINIMKIEITNE